jgi:segregation and condensation protein B
MPAFDESDHPSETSPAEDRETLPLFPDRSADEEEDEVWSGEDLERAYQEALQALDQLEQELPIAGAVFDLDSPWEEADEAGTGGKSLNDYPRLAEEPTEAASAETESIEDLFAAPRIQPAKIIEAALFVGGMPLTVKRLASVLREEFDRDFIERTIDDLNLRYDEENRPYEIRLEEGGYRMVLRPEFESVRNKSYGFGPKEVRLSQEALEVLALIAYRQPISKEQIEQAGKSHANGVLRQLLRREIVGLERTGKSAKDVTYHTTPRFLQIFGIADLSELPHAEDLSFK